MRTKFHFLVVFFTMITYIISADGIDLSNLNLLQKPSLNRVDQSYISENANMDNESSIDPLTYRIDGGDRFFISVIGISSMEYNLKVDQNGKLFVPEIGAVNLKNITLKNALKCIEDFVKNGLKKKYDVYVSFLGAKQVSVSIAGSVTNPGTYNLDGNLRVIDAIKHANNDTLPSIFNFDFRNVKFETPETTYNLDLFKYIVGNDLSQNLYLSPGAKISLSRAGEKILLNAQLKNGYSGLIPIKNAERAGDLFRLFEFNKSVDSNGIVYQKANCDYIKKIKWNELDTLVLHDMDILTFPPKKNYPKLSLCNITGEIAKPGVYPIIDKKTTVKEIIDITGGLTKFACENKVIILRINAAPNMSSLKIGRKIKENNLLEQISSVRPELTASIQKMDLTGDYCAIELKNNQLDEKLESGDEIIIPKIDKKIYLSGNVKEPGAYNFEINKNIKYYIKEAGGYTKKADKANVFVLSNYGNILQIKDINKLNGGDIVIIPDSQQYRTLNTLFLPFMQSIVLTVTAIISVISLAK